MIGTRQLRLGAKGKDLLPVCHFSPKETPKGRSHADDVLKVL